MTFFGLIEYNQNIGYFNNKVIIQIFVFILMLYYKILIKYIENIYLILKL